MDMAKKHGQMVHVMKEILWMERNKVKEQLSLGMALLLMENFLIMNSDMELMYGQIRVHIQVNGKIIKCMGKEKSGMLIPYMSTH